MKAFLCLFAFVVFSENALSQQRIEGRLLQERDSTPLVGATVTVKGTNIGTQTNSTGQFSILIDDSLSRKLSEVKLIFQFIGYTSLEIVRPNNGLNETLLVLLKVDNQLNDLVVVGYGTQVPEAVVTFPWPPPDFSTRTVIDRSYFTNSKNLFDVNGMLSDALINAGYPKGENAYYYVPNGFALVTKAEQITEDGLPLQPPDRWSAKVSSLKKVSFLSYLNALIFPAVGYFRVIVFIVTDKEFKASGKKVKKDDAIKWLKDGMNTLPVTIGNKKFGNNYNCTALIYQYKKPESAQAALLNPSDTSADEQLRKTNFFSSLKR
ncbi:MAG: carboxypeptidase-like regulatory domain-containing protein [Chitinophagaceae bacterium]|nr:MAG: carboxypeptidase-like regulatory domain-containing protein [Chitinophagaceae bacterium]